MIPARISSLLVLLILVSACTPAVTSAPTTTPTTTPSPTDAPAPTIMPLPTNTPTVSSVRFAASDGGTINGTLYGHSPQAIILSNTDDNFPSSWDPIVPELARDYMLLTYTYMHSDTARTDDLKDALAFIREQGATKIILIGASRGGIASVQVAADPKSNPDIVAVAALSAPRYYNGVTFYSDEMLQAIKVPKLLINSEKDTWAKDTQEMYDLFVEPKELHFYSGGAHGTDLFYAYRDDLIQRLVDFVKAGFAG